MRCTRRTVPVVAVPTYPSVGTKVSSNFLTFISSRLPRSLRIVECLGVQRGELVESFIAPPSPKQQPKDVTLNRGADWAPRRTEARPSRLASLSLFSCSLPDSYSSTWHGTKSRPASLTSVSYMGDTTAVTLWPLFLMALASVMPDTTWVGKGSRTKPMCSNFNASRHLAPVKVVFWSIHHAPIALGRVRYL